MEQRKDPRVVINVRVRRDSKNKLEERAAAWEMTPSDLHRAILAFGLANMPREVADTFRTRTPPKG